MIFELEDTSKVEGLFDSWEDTCIRSCLQKVMGSVFVTDTEAPVSAIAILDCYAFCAGEPDAELLGKPEGFVILVPLNEGWERLIEKTLPNAEKQIRYAIRKDTVFDREKLEAYVASLPEGYEIMRIDSRVYDLCAAGSFEKSFVSVFGSKELFLKLGMGFVIMKEGSIVAGASSYSRYLEGIEVQVETKKEERKKGLACVACAKLILACLDEGLYPSWDAANMASRRLAEKLGYEFDREYVSYEAE